MAKLSDQSEGKRFFIHWVSKFCPGSLPNLTVEIKMRGLDGGKNSLKLKKSSSYKIFLPWTAKAAHLVPLFLPPSVSLFSTRGQRKRENEGKIGNSSIVLSIRLNPWEKSDFFSRLVPWDGGSIVLVGYMLTIDDMASCL